MDDYLFRLLITEHLASYKKVKKAKGVSEIFLPGEIESRKERESLQNGLEIDPQVMEGLNEMLGATAHPGKEIS